jgi:hypothetical protein
MSAEEEEEKRKRSPLSYPSHKSFFKINLDNFAPQHAALSTQDHLTLFK